MNKPLKGTIRNAQVITGSGVRWIEGNVYSHDDFYDGQYIHTSFIVQVEETRVETRNSVYNIESWAEKPSFCE